MRTLWIALTIMISLALAGCRASQPAKEDSVPADPQVLPSQEFLTNIPENPLQLGNTPEPTEMTATSPTPADPGLQNLIEKAMADLAQRLSIPVNEIILLEATSVTWPDSSLGCPQPGMAYTQVPQDGLLIRLQADEQIYEYHSGGRHGPFLCVRSDKQPSPPPQIDIFNLTPPNPNSHPGTEVTPDNGTPPVEN